ncbi:MAG TPA: AI-2E family transporter [Croceibacterium sp.]|nr:AI-2E family transporter [Croceibacterium sp.]
MHMSSRQVLLVLVLALALWTAKAFLLPLLFGAVLAVSLWPINRQWSGTGGRLRRRLLVPLAITLATSLMLVLPLTVALVQAAGQGQALLDLLARAETGGAPPPAWLARLPLVGHSAVEWWHSHFQRPGALASGVTASALGTAAQWVFGMGGRVATGSLLLLVGLMALFFFLRDGDALASQTRRLARAQFGDFADRFLDQTVLAIRGTVIGTIAVAIGEGVLIGGGYALAGVPQPLLLALLTAAFAMLPFGAWAVFSVASLILAFNGDLAAAGLLFLYGGAVMLVGDNLVTPYLVGARLHLPLLVAFVGAFGGLAAFGLVGIFLGPVILDCLVILLREHGLAEAESPA